jgi:hypothetical protein
MKLFSLLPGSKLPKASLQLKPVWRITSRKMLLVGNISREVMRWFQLFLEGII